MWCNPLWGLATLTYHLIIFLRLTCAHKSAYIHLTPTANIIAYILSFLWFGAFFVMIFVSQLQSDGVHCMVVCGMELVLPPFQTKSQKLQFILVPTEWILLCDLAIRTTLVRDELAYGGDEDALRPFPLQSVSGHSTVSEV